MTVRVVSHDNVPNGNATWDGYRSDVDCYLPKGPYARNGYVAYRTSGIQLFDGPNGFRWSFFCGLICPLLPSNVATWGLSIFARR